MRSMAYPAFRPARIALWALAAFAGAPVMAQDASAAPSSEAQAEPAPAPAAETIAVEAAPKTANAAPAEADDGARAQRLDDVIVTATKRAQSQRDIPISIDSFKGKDLERTGATGLEQVLQNSPGVSFNKGTNPDNNYISIRGVSSEARNNIYSRPTGLFLEDTSLSNPSTLSVLADVDPFDLQSVEVLKGPQGTLFGGSALSGAIRYLPNAPDLTGTHFKVQGGSGFMADSTQRAENYALMANVPFGDSVGLRVAGVHRHNPGYMDDTKSGQKDANGSTLDQARGALLWQPLSQLSVQASYFYRTVDQANGGATDDPTGRTVNNRTSQTPTISKVLLPELRAEYDFGPSKLVGIYSRLKISGGAVSDLAPGLGLDATPIHATQPFVSNVSQPAYELRLVSNEPSEGGWSYLLGAYYMKSDQHLDTFTTIDALGANAQYIPPALFSAIQGLVNGLGVPLHSLRSVSDDVYIAATATEKALYFDLSKTLFDDWTLNLGGRYYDMLTDGKTEGGINGIKYGESLPQGTLLSAVTIHQPERGFNPKAALTWKISQRYSWYASASKGFRFGGINTVDSLEGTALNVPPTFKSDSLWNYESGLRTDWFDGKFLADLTLFYIDWKNLQVQQLKAGAVAYTDNVGGAHSKGAELGFKALLPGGFFATLGGAYVDAQTTKTFKDANGGDIAPGAHLPATPKVSASSSLSWNGDVLGVNVVPTYSVTYKGTSPNSLVNDIPLPSYVLHNASINLGLRQYQYQPELNFSVTNLFDRALPMFALSAPGGVLYVANQPRTFLMTLSLSY